jgi:GntR family transcriptional repressor for pyruvate dehydrogenase complex
VAPIRREPLAAEVARRLVDYLLSGGVEPGGRMPSERQLAEAFGVGRSAVREAIAALTLIGLIEVRH